jgi:hypothetical protein
MKSSVLRGHFERLRHNSRTAATLRVRAATSERFSTAKENVRHDTFHTWIL